MANAKAKVETKVTGVTLELTAEEADYIRCAVGRASGGELEGTSVYNALYGLVPQVFEASGTALRVERRRV